MIETKGYTGSIEATDAMAKAANKSALLGLLYGVPLFGNAVPLLLGVVEAASLDDRRVGHEARDAPHVSRRTARPSG